LKGNTGKKCMKKDKWSNKWNEEIKEVIIEGNNVYKGKKDENYERKQSKWGNETRDRGPMREGIKSEERRQGNGAGNRRNEGNKNFLYFFYFFQKNSSKILFFYLQMF
jgi:hypothetical protein